MQFSVFYLYISWVCSCACHSICSKQLDDSAEHRKRSDHFQLLAVPVNILAERNMQFPELPHEMGTVQCGPIPLWNGVEGAPSISSQPFWENTGHTEQVRIKINTCYRLLRDCNLTSFNFNCSI